MQLKCTRGLHHVFFNFLGLGVKNRSSVICGFESSVFFLFASPATGRSSISKPSRQNSSHVSGSNEPPLASLCPLAK
jgi:hypothetical protein